MEKSASGATSAAGLEISRRTKMVLKRIKYSSWSELRKQALKYEQLGYVCEVKGWADIGNNVLSISESMEEEDET